MLSATSLAGTSCNTASMKVRQEAFCLASCEAMACAVATATATAPATASGWAWETPQERSASMTTRPRSSAKNEAGHILLQQRNQHAARRKQDACRGSHVQPLL